LVPFFVFVFIFAVAVGERGWAEIEPGARASEGQHPETPIVRFFRGVHPSIPLAPPTLCRKKVFNAPLSKQRLG
jgi:hypothetical protein